MKFTVLAIVAAVLGGCTGQTLRQPGTLRQPSPAPGSYEFSDIVVRDSNVPTRPNGKAIRFQVRWLGPGQPKIVACVFGIRDETGILATKRSTVYSAEDSVEPRLEVILSDPAINGRPSDSLDATIECHPLASPYS